MGTGTTTLIGELRTLLAPEHLLAEAADIRPYGFDGTAGIKGSAAAVVFPQNTEQVSQIVQLCAAHDTTIVSRGSGTGLSGGSIPSENCVVLCTVDMNRILETDTKNLTMLVETGVLTKDIDETSAAYNLFYPPDPGSIKISTIGGNVANNSGGLRGLKYGVTRDYVMGLEVVTADGTVQWLGSKCVKDVAGYSLRDVFIGSEGTLGIITKVLIKLIPRPKSKSTLLATYPSMQAAAETVSAIIAAQIIPCTLEFLDRKTIACVEDFAKVGLPACEALLFMETDGHPVVVADEIEAMERIARECGASDVTRAKDDQHAIQLATARRSAFSALARIRPTTILEDATVPRSDLAKMVRFIEATGQKYNLQIATFGHMGDGNLHPTFLTDERDTKEMERVEQAMKEIFDFTIALGGTITGEHGVGLAKRKFLPSQFDAGSFALLKKVKRALDPHNRLNPGKIFELEDASTNNE